MVAITNDAYDDQDVDADSDNSDDDENDTSLNIIEYQGSKCLKMKKLNKQGKIKLNKFIGEGSMNKVYNACIDDNCIHVLKIIPLHIKAFGDYIESEGVVEKWVNSIKLLQTRVSLRLCICITRRTPLLS